MKKFVLATMVVLFVASVSYAGPVISINLRLGLRSQPETCPEFGWCRFRIGMSLNDGYINGSMEIKEERSSYIIAINEQDLLKYQPDKIVYFKGKPSVIFTEDFSYPAEVNKALKASKPLLTKKGEYPLSYRNGYYYIEFPL